MSDLMDILSDIDSQKEKLDKLRPLPKALEKSLREKAILEWTWNSTNIEGNTFTLTETKVLLEYGITIGGKSLREHLEIVNHKEAIFFVEELASRKERLGHSNIRKLHFLVMKSIDVDNAGVYRNENVVISGAGFRPPSHWHVQELMDHLVSWYNLEADKMHPVMAAARLHAELARIHPFRDGNGRTARLLMNLHLMKCGYPIAVLKSEDRLMYFTALDRYGTSGDIHPFAKFLATAVRFCFDLYVDLASDTPTSRQDDGPPSPS